MKRCFLLFLTIFSLNTSQSQCIDTLLIDSLLKRDYCNIKPYNLSLDNEYNKPVCGCDTITYPNIYCAKASGITRWVDGPCRCIEPNLIDTSKTEHYFNPFPNEQVCGCNNKTYLSPIHAYYSGIRTWTEGSCKCLDSSVIDLNLDLTKCRQQSKSSFYSSLLNPDFRLSHIRGCDGKLYLDICEAYFRFGITKFHLVGGLCSKGPIDSTYKCSEEYNPVCGCDFKEYKNPCIAEKHFGIKDYYIGPCRCTLPEIIGKVKNCTQKSSLENYDPFCSCDGKTYFSYCDAINRFGVYEPKKYGACSCLDSSFVVPSIVCNETFSPICGCDGHVYKNLCHAIFKNGVLKFNDCKCLEPELINDTVDCNVIFDQKLVCGCDGRTYPNSCYAQFKAGVTRLADNNLGPCPNTCKDTILILKNIPCSDVIDPVCGCDQVTYDNECIARYKFGVVKWKNGPCISSNGNNSIYSNKTSLYPNPAVDVVTLFNQNGKVYKLLEIFNSCGVLIFSKMADFSDGSSISLDPIDKSGLYFLHLTSSTEKSIIKLVVHK